METQTQNPTQTESAQGRRPRWTDEEDAFLAEKKREGLAKKDILAAYRKRFPSADRPDNGVLARIPTMARARGEKDESTREMERERDLDLVRKQEPLSLGERVERIFGLIEELPQEEQSRVLSAVGTLCGLNIPAMSAAGSNGSGAYAAPRPHQHA